MDEKKFDENNPENLLERDKDPFQIIINNANEGFVFIDPKGEIIYSNKTTSLLSEYDNKELLGINFKKLIHPDEVQKVINTFKSKIEELS